MEPITMGALIPAPLEFTIAAGLGVIAAFATALTPLVVALHHAFKRNEESAQFCPSPEAEGDRDWTVIAWPDALRLPPGK